MHAARAELQAHKPLEELTDIWEATRLLTEMVLELQALALENAWIAQSWSVRGAAARAQLCTLHKIVGALMHVNRRAEESLKRSARELIALLSAEMDRLMLCEDDQGACETLEPIWTLH